MKTCLKLLVALLILALTGACGGRKEISPEENAERLFLDGERQLERGLWDDALGSWEQLRDTFYSPELSMLAELKIAETYYRAARYAEAASAYESYLQRYPNDVRAATLLYRLGQSYYQQILSADRDQSNTRKALQTFEQFIRRYPDDPDREQAELQILRARTRLADHEVYVGRFYLKRKLYQPAINRFEGILKEFPDYYYRDEAFFYLGTAYLENGQADKGRDTLQQLLEQFPASAYFDKAQKLLARDG
ncbi:MAG: outer membrane protein assembly factor BamD [Pelovirga sp.]